MQRQLKAIFKKNQFVYHSLKRIKNIAVNYRLHRNSMKNMRLFVHSYNVQEIFLQQNRMSGYNRLDTIVRLLAIENEYGMNDFGWKLYAKMQDIRVADEEPTTDERINWFKDLIKSWNEKGYDENSTIVLDRNLMLVDGSHRMAMAIFHGLEKINCQVLPMQTDIIYDVRWFVENGFDLEDIELIEKRAEKLIQDNKIRISCILWPPALPFFDEISEKILYLYSVASIKDEEYRGECFGSFVQSVYEIDDIEQWKIDTKKEYMSNGEQHVVRHIEIEFDTPVYRIKDITKELILTQGEELKKIIRNCYSSKVDNYFYDIICHTGDNVEQSKYIARLFTHDFNQKEFFAGRVEKL